MCAELNPVRVIWRGFVLPPNRGCNDGGFARPWPSQQRRSSDVQIRGFSVCIFDSRGCGTGGNAFGRNMIADDGYRRCVKAAEMKNGDNTMGRAGIFVAMLMAMASLPLSVQAMSVDQAVEAVKFAQLKTWICTGDHGDFNTSDVFQFRFEPDQTFYGIAATAVAIDGRKYGMEGEINGRYDYDGVNVVITVDEFRETTADSLPRGFNWGSGYTYRMRLLYTVNPDVPYLLEGEQFNSKGFKVVTYRYCYIHQ